MLLKYINLIYLIWFMQLNLILKKKKYIYYIFDIGIYYIFDIGIFIG